MLSDQGDFIPRSTLLQPLRRKHLADSKIAGSDWKAVSRAVFEKLWQSEFEEHAGQSDEELFYIATGVLLPVWNALGSDFVNVVRIVAESGTHLLGRQVPQHAVPALLKRFGRTGREPVLDPDAVVAALNQGGAVSLSGRHDISLRRSLVNGSRRFEVSAYPHGLLGQLKALGCFTEIIGFKTRVFLPAGRAADVVQAILDLD